jgi:hypothetical protein
VRTSLDRLEREIAKWRRSRTHLLRRESPALDTVLMSVVQRMGMGFGCASRDSRKVVSISACSLESAGTANAAESVCSGSTGFPAILASFGVCNVKACL